MWVDWLFFRSGRVVLYEGEVELLLARAEAEELAQPVFPEQGLEQLPLLGQHAIGRFADRLGDGRGWNGHMMDGDGQGATAGSGELASPFRDRSLSKFMD